MIKLTNERYDVLIDLQNAEVASFYDKQQKIEYMWNGDPKHWSGRNPILFPVIGSSANNTYVFNDEIYEMGNHGFLRHSLFEYKDSNETEATLTFMSNDETLNQYPFLFEIEVTYKLIDNKLEINYRIYNKDYKEMPFSFGLHPAFNCPLDDNDEFDDYQVKFSSKVKAISNMSFETEAYKSFNLNYDLFEKYKTIFFHDFNCNHIGFTNGKNGVDVSVVGYPVVAIWTKDKAPFVCIEPWSGLPKKSSEPLEFIDKDASCLLQPQKHRLFTYHIAVY